MLTATTASVITLIIYSLLNYVPYMLLALYAFRTRLRFSRGKTYVLAVVSILLQCGISMYIALGASSQNQAEALNYLKTILNVGFIFLAIKVTTSKLLFTMFVLTNIANFIVCTSKCLEVYLFPYLPHDVYNYPYALTLLLLEAPILYAVYRYIKTSFTAILRDTISTQIWNKIWLIPAIFYFIWYYLFYHLTSMDEMELAMMPSVAIFSGLLLICQFLCYEIALSFALSHSDVVLLQQQKGNYMILSKEFQELKEEINNARRANHDLRHHLTVLSEHMLAGNYSELSDYLSTLLKNVPSTATKSFCEHPIINLLLAYAYDIAKENDITYDVQTAFPTFLPFSDSDLTIIWGNFLENACHACKEQAVSDRKIKVRGYVNDNYLICTIDNTYENKIMKNRAGAYISTKPGGNGIGIESARHAIEKYNGVLKINTQNMMFCVSFMLPLGSLK